MVEEAGERGLAAIAITDHDVLDGMAEVARAADELGIGFLTGIELTADWEGRTIHLLGYGIDPSNGPLKDALGRARRLMGEHVERVLGALDAAGESLARSDLEKYRTRYVGGASLVLAMVERGVLRRAKDAPALLRLASHEPRAYTAAEAIALIHRAAGVAILAHPARVGRAPRAPREPSLLTSAELEPLVAAGLDGLEVWQVVHGPTERQHYRAVAEELGLLVAGGSDCHGPHRGGGPRIGSQRVPYPVFERLSEAAAARRADPNAAPG